MSCLLRKVESARFALSAFSRPAATYAVKLARTARTVENNTTRRSANVGTRSTGPAACYPNTTETWLSTSGWAPKAWNSIGPPSSPLIHGRLNLARVFRPEGVFHTSKMKPQYPQSSAVGAVQAESGSVVFRCRRSATPCPTFEHLVALNNLAPHIGPRQARCRSDRPQGVCIALIMDWEQANASRALRYKQISIIDVRVSPILRSHFARLSINDLKRRAQFIVDFGQCPSSRHRRVAGQGDSAGESNAQRLTRTRGPRGGVKFSDCNESADSADVVPSPLSAHNSRGF